MGGGIRNLETAREIFSLGTEKIVINSYAAENPAFITAAAELFGSQSIVVSLDVKKASSGEYMVHTHSGKISTGQNAVEFAVMMEQHGAGEIFLNTIDRDGMMDGYDLGLIRQVSEAVGIPVIACGGAENTPISVQRPEQELRQWQQVVSLSTRGPIDRF